MCFLPLAQRATRQNREKRAKVLCHFHVFLGVPITHTSRWMHSSAWVKWKERPPRELLTWRNSITKSRESRRSGFPEGVILTGFSACDDPHTKTSLAKKSRLLWCLCVCLPAILCTHAITWFLGGCPVPQLDVKWTFFFAKGVSPPFYDLSESSCSVVLEHRKEGGGSEWTSAFAKFVPFLCCEMTWVGSLSVEHWNGESQSLLCYSVDMICKFVFTEEFQ